MGDFVCRDAHAGLRQGQMPAGAYAASGFTVSW
jgi:hypothetical protein